MNIEAPERIVEMEGHERETLGPHPHFKKKKLYLGFPDRALHFLTGVKSLP
jgi:hypothetical protein